MYAVYVSLTECNSGTNHNLTFGIITVSELKKFNY